MYADPRARRGRATYSPAMRPSASVVVASWLAAWLCSLPGASAAGTSLRFRGTGEGDIDRVKVRIDAPAVPADIGAGAFTVEFFLRTLPGENGAGACVPGNDGWIYGNVVIDRDVYGAGDSGDYGISLFADGLGFGVARGSSGAGVCGTTNLADGRWHHVAATRETSGRIRLFVDGRLEAEAPGPTGDLSYRNGRATPWPNDPFVVFGAEKHDAGPEYPSFSGWLDEVRLSTTVRYTGTFTPPSAPFATDAATAALWHFDEGTGTSVLDSSGAAGGPSHGVLRVGGDPAGPAWSTETPFSAPPLPAPRGPVALDPGRRQFRDANGVPFLVAGDAAWSLLVQLTLPEAEQYLDNRREKGFDTLLVNLVEHQFADDAPNNRAGDPPFLVPGDFSTPNEAYFAHADAVLRAAGRRGITILLAPVYLGYNCGAEGWCQEVLANSEATMRGWGRYVGARYGRFPNVFWILGGDTDPGAARSRVDQVARGILDEDPFHLLTGHGAPEQAARDAFPTEPWLSADTVYTYGLTHAASRAAYDRTPALPFFLVESNYENERGATTQWIRRQAWWSILEGATGHVMGNRPIWLFDPGWQAAMDGAGSRSSAQLHGFLARRGWNRLVPDRAHAIVTSGYGNPAADDYATAAATPDGRLLVAYLPTARTVTVDMTRLSDAMHARWFDPSSGALTNVAGSPFSNTGSRTFTPPVPGTNAEGSGDWVLVLEGAGAVHAVLRRAGGPLPLDPTADRIAFSAQTPVRLEGDAAALPGVVYYDIPDARTLAVVRDGADVVLHYWF